MLANLFNVGNVVKAMHGISTYESNIVWHSCTGYEQRYRSSGILLKTVVVLQTDVRVEVVNKDKPQV
jgi:hypothetical protein